MNAPFRRVGISMKLPTVPQIHTANARKSVYHALLVMILVCLLLWMLSGRRLWERTRHFRSAHPMPRTPRKPNPSTVEAVDFKPIIDLTAGDYSEIDKSVRPPNDVGFSPAEVSPETNEFKGDPQKIMAEFYFLKARMKIVEDKMGVRSAWPEMTR